MTRAEVYEARNLIDDHNALTKLLDAARGGREIILRDAVAGTTYSAFGSVAVNSVLVALDPVNARLDALGVVL